MTKTELFAILLLPTACNGCGTIVTLSDDRTYPNQVYAGVQIDGGPCTGGDIPFSLVADTLALPYTIPRTIYNQNHPLPAATQPS